jgi:cytochrome c2
MRVLKLAVPAAMVLAGLAVTTLPTKATPAYAKATGKPCTTCHVKVGAMADMKKDPNLNAVGKCFKAQADKAALSDACKSAK